MAKRRPADLDPIPAEEILGREDPDGDNDGEAPPAAPQRAQQPPPRSAPGDRAIIAAVVIAVVLGGAGYAFRNEISAQYERRVHPERYWAKEVNHRQFALKLSQIQEKECLVDLLAARMKEPINAARSELLGASPSEARQWAAEETASQEQACSAFADFVNTDRERLAAAERELAGVRSRRAAGAGLILARSG